MQRYTISSSYFSDGKKHVVQFSYDSPTLHEAMQSAKQHVEELGTNVKILDSKRIR